LSFLITSCKKDIVNPDNGQSSEPNTEEPVVEEPIEVDTINEKLLKMSLEEKIGQLLIIGLEDKVVNDTTRIMIEEYKVGGFIYFARNIESNIQLLKLTKDLKSLNENNPVPLFVSIDEEGGRVSRLPKEYRRLPESKIIGDFNDPQLSYKYGELLGLRLNTIGINLNFAPVLDINSNPNNPVIGNRSFGKTAEVVSTNGIALLKGIESTGVIPTVKHFPGHGDTSIDSHINLPIVNKKLKELKGLELMPFKLAIEENVDMIMVAHILFPELDPLYPSTMSKKIITELLRKDLGYDGVVISDDMTMGAIIENYTLDGAVLEFLKAGGDIALICHGQDNPIKVINFIKESINNGEITLEEIDEKVYRILSLKEKYKLIDNVEDNLSLDELNNKTNELLEKLKQ
jgi:beta-N-acetylhexosaminidase